MNEDTDYNISPEDLSDTHTAPEPALPSQAEKKNYTVPGADARSQLSNMYQNWFLEYASYVILERAVPHIEDGLKPVQRRILHSMYTLDDGRFNKVANIVGNTMQYHPHGDASIADALVQLGQKELLVDTQGQLGQHSHGGRGRSIPIHRGTPLGVRPGDPLQPQNHGLDPILRRPQEGACDTAREIPFAALARRGGHCRGPLVQDSASQFRRDM